MRYRRILGSALLECQFEVAAMCSDGEKRRIARGMME
jgi:hypothetical protein